MQNLACNARNGLVKLSSFFLLAGSLVASAIQAQGASPVLPPEAYVADFDFLWKLVGEEYAYLDQKQTDWKRVRDLYRPRVAEVRSRRDFVALLENVLHELYDPHAHLGTNTASSARLIPSGAEVWAEWKDGHAMITAVRSGSQAERSGLRSGHEVITVGGVRVADAVAARMPKALRAPDSAAANWALRAVLAGRRDQRVRLTTRMDSANRAFDFVPQSGVRVTAPVTATLLAGNIGYIRINNALGESALVAAYDSVLETFRPTRALVLDLRDTPGGGNTAVARAIMSRLVTKEQPYQRHERPTEARSAGVRRVWVEYVLPRGPFAYTSPMVVLVGRWTGSMGEGLAIGLDGMKRATVIGTRMAGLLGAIYDFTLPNTGFSVRIPGEQLFHIDGRPREMFAPQIPVEQLGPGVDVALETARKLLGQSR